MIKIKKSVYDNMTKTHFFKRVTKFISTNTIDSETLDILKTPEIHMKQWNYIWNRFNSYSESFIAIALTFSIACIKKNVDLKITLENLEKTNDLEYEMRIFYSEAKVIRFSEFELNNG